MIREYRHCRICESTNIEVVISFGETALANAFLRSEDMGKEELKAPLSVFLCKACGSVQLTHTVAPHLIFTDYIYESSTTASYRNHFKSYAEHVCNRFRPDFICEIGSNDGILLKPLKDLGCRVLGIEPAKNLAAKADNQGLPTINAFFNREVAAHIRRTFGSAQVVTANNVFAHIDDLHEIVEGVKLLLAKEGVFIFENAYLLSTIQNLYFDQIYCEHLFYHSIKPLMNLFAQHGLEMFDVQHNDNQGGTIRGFVQVQNGPYKKEARVAEFRKAEDDFRLYEPETYRAFVKRIAEIREELHQVLSQFKKRQASICAFGAPAKFTTFCKGMGLDRTVIEFVIDDAPLKQGRYTPETHIPVVPRSWLYDRQPEVCIITAWNHAQGIIESNQSYQGQWIIAMPRIEIIKHA